MALKTLILENFRGKTQTYNLNPQSNRIRGQNGAGKSTLKEAIIFAFCGTDSVGSRNPQHLISTGADATSVIVESDKATLSRTLTRKGNGTIKLTRNGIPNVVTQSQLEQMIGSLDLFLSLFQPGYFMRLPMEKQHKVLSEVLPKIDRDRLFEEMAGFACGYNLSKRSDIVLDMIATDRRVIERTADTKRGELQALRNIQPLPKPQEPEEVRTLTEMEASDRAWATYRTERQAYDSACMQRDWVQANNQKREQRRLVVLEELSAIQFESEPPVVDTSSEREELRKQLKTPPAYPLLVSVTDAEHCPSCGQTVGAKHRESVKVQNAKLLEMYEDQKRSVEQFNQQIEAKQAELRQKQAQMEAERSRVVLSNHHKQTQKAKLEVELTNLGPLPLPPMPPEPAAPAQHWPQAERNRVQAAVEQYRRELAQYEYVAKRLADAEPRIQSLEQEIANLESEVVRLQRIAEVVKILPQEELKRQLAVLAMPNLELQVGEEIRLVTKGGMPYELLSTGQAMKADVELCLKLNSLRPLGMLFVDNADLVDELSIAGVQWFTAEVVPGQKEVTIDAA